MHRILLILIFPILAYSQDYQLVTGKTCDGYPQISVGSIPGSCIGLVASSQLKDKNGETLKFPRKIIELKPNLFLISDMGGWEPPFQGKIWLLDSSQNKLTKLIDKLTLPHGLAIGPDGMIYVGEMGLIFKFDPNSPKPSQTCQTVIHNLPSTVLRTKGNPCIDEKVSKATQEISHPLVSFTFSKNPSTAGNLIVNSGSSSDNCTDKSGKIKVDSQGRCSEMEGSNPGASVREYEYLGNGNWNPNFRILARGLRNSMVLVSHESGNIIQMENSMDFPDAKEPFEEINILKEARHYGWPYCFNFKGQNPIYNLFFKCDGTNKSYEEPYALIPPHTAPLDGLYYSGNMFPELQNTLLVSWHGYRGTGQRIVSYPTNTDGLPYVSQDTFYYNSYNPKTDKTQKIQANPAGGLVRTASYTEVVFDWYKVPNLRPIGAPVGLTVASDGAIWVVEDKNKTILRIAKGKSSNDNGSNQNSSTLDEKKFNDSVFMARWSKIQKNILTPQCATCHNQVQNQNGKELIKELVSSGWMNPGNSSESLIVKRLKGGEMRLMPPQGPLQTRDIQAIEQFIDDLD
ncbi:MAG: PQQ-dependent sugar dehydrogenase [Bdellovibrionota bacterium]